MCDFYEYFQTFSVDPLDEVMCPSPTPIPNTDFERMEGWLTSNGAIHGTVLEYSCSIGYRDSRTPCLPTRRTCHAGEWIGNMPSCGMYHFCNQINLKWYFQGLLVLFQHLLTFAKGLQA